MVPILMMNGQSLDSARSSSRAAWFSARRTRLFFFAAPNRAASSAIRRPAAWRWR